jgi:hypothetical protein
MPTSRHAEDCKDRVLVVGERQVRSGLPVTLLEPGMLMRPISLAGIFAAVSGLFSGWIVVLEGIAATPDGHLPSANVYKGIAESLSLGFVCFGFLAAAWLLAGVGMLRREYLQGGN